VPKRPDGRTSLAIVAAPRSSCEEEFTVTSNSDSDTKTLRERLERERASLASEIPQASELAELYPQGEVLDPEDISINETERDVQLEVASRRSTRLVAVTDALARIDDGSFGRCLECDEPISAARLDADPAVTLCIECQRRIEERNPVRTPEL
jgi:DnaK suppressor protein